MTLNDLKDGMVVVLRNGDPYIVLRNVFLLWRYSCRVQEYFGIL